MASVLVLKNAEVYNPNPIGKKDILCIEGKIIKVGTVETGLLDNMDIEYKLIDLEGRIVVPGFIDPHQHIIGGSGERGFKSRSPEVTIPEIVIGGITTVVGCIGVDTFTRNMPSLLAQAKLYNEEGLTAYIWSGGYDVPPTTLTGSIRNDMILVAEVIGAGEVAISDIRSSKPTVNDLARIVSDTHNGGLLTRKSGVTHFHLGDGRDYLKPLFELLSNYDVSPFSLYPTHVNRNAELLRQGAEISNLSVTVDFDVCGGDLVPSIEQFVKAEGNFNFLTLSSDASFVSPAFMFDQVKDCLKHFNWPLEKMLPLITTNTAKVLKLKHKGKIEEGYDADLVVMTKEGFNITDVIASGKLFIEDSKLVYHQKYLDYSNRKIEIYGKKTTW